jgi:endonuclease/exonuclease/phosphatase family metal-dependent hydrolase
LSKQFKPSDEEVAMKIRREGFCIKLVFVTALACLLCIGLNSASFAESDKLTVRVMTRNMDAGTDLNYVTAPGADFEVALQMTFAEVYASNIPARAEQLAEEIATVEPDLIALQEVTLWIIPGPNGPVVYDQLELLKTALDAKGQHYRVVAVQPLTDISLPISESFTAWFTDHNAILVRSDLPPGHLDIIGIESHLYENQLYLILPPLSSTPIPIPNGWMAVDVKIRGARFKFVNTHLLSPVPEAVSQDDFDLTSALQQAQAEELLDALSATSLPVILAGDFNSDAEVPQHTPDNTPTAAIISSSGYVDIWHYLNPEGTGYTWPLFFEDQLSIYNPTSPFERIDLIFSRGPVPLAVERTGTDFGPSGVFASDHVGVVADFALENHRPDAPKGKKK